MRARRSRSWPASGARSGTSRTGRTGGRRADEDGIAPVGGGCPTTSRHRARKWGGASVITDERGSTPRRSSSTPGCSPRGVILDPRGDGGPARTAHRPRWAWMPCHTAWKPSAARCFHPLAQGIAVEGIRLVHDWLPRVCEDGTRSPRPRPHAGSPLPWAPTRLPEGARRDAFPESPLRRAGARHPPRPDQRPSSCPTCSPSTGRRWRIASAPSPATWACPGPDSWRCSTGCWACASGSASPHTLRDIGVEEAHVARLAPMAEKDPSSATNPVPLTAENLDRLYRHAIAGEL